MSATATWVVATLSFNSASGNQGVAAPDPNRPSRLIMRTESSAVWLGTGDIKTDMPAGAFNLKAGKEYDLRLPRKTGIGDQSFNVATTSSTDVTLTYLYIYED